MFYNDGAPTELPFRNRRLSSIGFQGTSPELEDSVALLLAENA